MTDTPPTPTSRAELVENLRQQLRFHVDRAERHRIRAEKAEAELEALRLEASR